MIIPWVISRNYYKMSELREMRNDIAASLFLLPCTFEELMKRDFLKNKSEYGVQHFIRDLERVDAVYYKVETIHIKKKWAKENLQEYEIDFRTDKERYIDGMTDFERSVYGL